MSEYPGHDDAEGLHPGGPRREPLPAAGQEAATEELAPVTPATVPLPGLPLGHGSGAPELRAPAHWDGAAHQGAPAYAPAAGHHNPYADYAQHASPVAQAYPGAWDRPGPDATQHAGGRRPAPGRGWGAALAAGAVAGALVGGLVGWGVSASGQPQGHATGGGVVIQNPQSATSVTAAAAKALPSVVTISVTRGSAGGSGSGIVVDQEGHILTNQHVATLAGATAQGTIDVMTSDGRVLPAKLVGQDPLYDLAVLKVDGAGLTAAAWADLSKLNVGDVAVAIGAPMGLPNSVSDGVVSNLDRSIPVSSSAVDESESSDEGDDRFSLPDQNGSSSAKGQVSLNVIQTDAAINHGNSGGALVNAAGELIGVNVAIFSPTEQGGSIGLGFAIRGDIAQRVANELIKNGKASHGKLGVSIRSAQVNDNGSNTGFTNGATVADVPSDSAAGRAGLRTGDVIVKVGERPTIDATDVTATVRSYAAGTQVPITVRRGGGEEVLKVTLDEASS